MLNNYKIIDIVLRWVLVRYAVYCIYPLSEYIYHFAIEIYRNYGSWIFGLCLDMKQFKKKKYDFSIQKSEIGIILHQLPIFNGILHKNSISR